MLPATMGKGFFLAAWVEAVVVQRVAMRGATADADASAARQRSVVRAARQRNNPSIVETVKGESQSLHAHTAIIIGAGDRAERARAEQPTSKKAAGRARALAL